MKNIADPPRKSIGVVLCTYNGEKYLREQLDSILCQTRAPDQILILDDCSNDRTIEIIENFLKKDGRIRLIRNETNLGYARNFEKGISLCETDFIALSDQDDIWFNDKLERLADELEANPGAGIAFCNAEYMLDDGTRTGEIVFKSTDGSPGDPVLARRKLLSEHWGVDGNLILMDSEMKRFILPNTIIRSHGHDSWICLNAFFLRTPRYIQEPLSLYRLHPNMASGAIGFVLKGTSYELKKKWYDHRRVARNLIRIISSPVKRPKILRERELRAHHYASDMLMILDELLERRRHLNLPQITVEEQLFFQEMRNRWKADLIDSAHA
ncbi:MAG: hypothetical protein A2Z46_04265 [Nitrospirae bacterium RBG_19FT_COMBO_55_12]|nr:MAG: hypothetical protein A2Z46_04265 [Nitrospirae bacterium RBG_19FT_COMBO_55_12]